MNWLVDVLDFIGQQILNVPAYLVGIIVAVGLIALRKGAGQVIGGALKATLGFLILGAGAGVVVDSLEPLGELVLGVTGAEGVVPTNEVVAGRAGAAVPGHSPDHEGGAVVGVGRGAHCAPTWGAWPCGWRGGWRCRSARTVAGLPG